MRVAHEQGLVEGCDCSGFVAWCLGVDRYLATQFPHYEMGQWFETSAVYKDAKSPFGFVTEVPWKASLPGDVLVYGDRKDSAGKVRQGHIGIVSEVTDQGPVSVVHCSLGNWKREGDAIWETDCTPFIAGQAITAAVAWVTT
jgi:cell wall-associated NlpC family hydrolase